MILILLARMSVFRNKITMKVDHGWRGVRLPSTSNNNPRIAGVLEAFVSFSKSIYFLFSFSAFPVN